ncbi:MAG: extracellular solute-binding protein [Hoeflea sp.]|uniref:ABC transporter substrate-binding protein n=1 Tax=Hoeflea sp. TaxID=1940281 RepID=UPI001DC07A3E|nr:extracellular solute-binding protein [Hoeflea sp.]MBU4531920.1 extracellular solute-binding protein [Alphaproteobacteria bacterium]MBU4546342.1 extracellular solute-binding protein [Alphaproteobacteria bacterium]MBU4549471.1 extracellular solute-binding protein [Alphaproteobacteria bacterium]MBV1722646.1 extracellular solute-binding protein [Hoeflea sp.]MBV1782584.1 extracellular solute-binding protein [Hoeflea sp.]
MRKKLIGMAGGLALALASSTSVLAQELTIFWAEWDPANYLQELVNEYEAETGVQVTVETTPWSDFQTKTFTELNAKGSAYDMVVGDSQWLGAASEAGHYVDLTEFFNKHNLGEVMAPATVKYYAEYPSSSGKYWAIPAEGDAVGWSYRKDWFEDPAEMEAFKAKYGYDLAVPATWAQMRDIAEFFHRPDQGRYGIAIYTDNSYDGLVMGVENAIFSYGGELGNYETYEVDGIINSEQNIAALEMYRELYGFTPPGWAKTFFVENNQAITENLAAMSMNYFAFFPALTNEASNPNAKVTGFFANPAGPDGHQFAALGGQGISVISYSENQEESMKFLEWFIKDDVQKRWAELGGYTASAAVLESEEFQNATPYNKAFYETMFKVKDFWATPEYAELLIQMNQRIYPYITGGEGTAKDALDSLATDWNATFKKYNRVQ